MHFFQTGICVGKPDRDTAAVVFPDGILDIFLGGQPYDDTPTVPDIPGKTAVGSGNPHPVVKNRGFFFHPVMKENDRAEILVESRQKYVNVFIAHVSPFLFVLRLKSSQQLPTQYISDTLPLRFNA
jgi:hypothetical protein